jgi:hypothetical protein
MVAIIYDRAVIDSKSAEKSPKFKRGMPSDQDLVKSILNFDMSVLTVEQKMTERLF